MRDIMEEVTEVLIRAFFIDVVMFGILYGFYSVCELF